MITLANRIGRDAGTAWGACLDRLGSGLADALSDIAATLWLARAARRRDGGSEAWPRPE